VLARKEAFALGEQARAARIDSPSVPWRAPAAIALQRLVEEDEARELAAEQLALARRWGAASDIGAALRLNARVDAERRLELLEESIALLETAPWRLELSRARWSTSAPRCASRAGARMRTSRCAGRRSSPTPAAPVRCVPARSTASRRSAIARASSCSPAPSR